MYDLIYAGNTYYAESQALLKRVYPDAVFEDASDFIHEGRYSIETGQDENLADYYTNMLVLGICDSSFSFSLAVEMGSFPTLRPDEQESVRALKVAFARAPYLRQDISSALSAGVL